MVYLQEHPIIILIILAVGTAVFYIGRWAGNVNADRTLFNDFMARIEKKFDEINKHIIEIFKRLPEPATAGTGPLVLTDFGKKISRTSNARKVAERLGGVLLNEIKGMPEYEIQAFASDYLKNRFRPTEEEASDIKRCQYEEGVSREVVVDEVIMIELRDKLFELTGHSVNR